MAPVMKQCTASEPLPIVGDDALTPIDEDDEENEPNEDVPEIVETAPSPSGGQPQSTAIEINQIESVL